MKQRNREEVTASGATNGTNDAACRSPDAAVAETTVPVVREELHVGRRVVESGRVRLRKVVREEEQTIDQPLARQEVTVERVPIDRPVDGPQPTRTEGDVVIIPVVEEVTVIEKRWVLKEELHVRKRTVEERRPQTVTLRREEVIVERIPTDPESAPEPAPPPGSSTDASRDAGKDGTTVARQRRSKRQ